MVQIVWSLLAAAVAVDAIPGYGACPASDKCLGAIKAHENAAKEYCISALEKTVTSGQPCTKTVTTRVTKTSTILRTKTNTVISTDKIVSTFTPVETVSTTTTVPAAALAVRTAATPQLEECQPPSYATKFCNGNQFKSACSCIGIWPSTKTVTPSEQTATVTSTYTTRVTSTKTIAITSTTTAFTTETATPSTTTDVVTSTALPIVPPEPPRGSCQIVNFDNFYLMSTDENPEYLNIDSSAIITAITGTESNMSEWYADGTGLFKAAGPSQFALATSDGGDFSFIFGSTDPKNAGLLNCLGPYGTKIPLSCSQGKKTTFYECPAQANGSTIAIGNPTAVAAGKVGAGCRAIVFEADIQCQK